MLVARSNWPPTFNPKTGRLEEDIATEYLHAYGQVFVNYLRSPEGGGHEVTDLNGDLADTLINFEAQMPTHDALCGFGHGNTDIFTGNMYVTQDNEVDYIEILLKSVVNADALANKSCYLASCLTGVNLGPKMVETGCLQYHGYQCLSEDSLVLTENGWKGINDIHKDDKALTLNLKTKVLEYSKISRIVSYDYEGEMYHVSNQRTSQLVTPNHKLLYTSYLSKKIKTAEVSSVAINHTSRVTVPAMGEYYAEEYPIRDHELALWAWVLAEGNIRHVKNQSRSYKGDRIVIGQSLKHQKEIERIRELLTLNKIVWEEKDYNSPWSEVPIRRFIFHKNGFSKTMPMWLLRLSRRQARMFLNEYRLGDGFKRNFILATKKEHDVKILTAIAILAGYLFRVTQKSNKNNGVYRISIISCKDRTWARIQKEEYKGRVWCVTTDNGTLICAHKGRAAITGNCDMIFVFDPTYWLQGKLLEDPVAQPFMDCFLTTGYSMVLGDDPKTVYEKTISRYNWWWDYWYRQNHPLADDILTYLHWDRQNFISITGDGVYARTPVTTLNLGALTIPLGAAALFFLMTAST